MNTGMKTQAWNNTTMTNMNNVDIQYEVDVQTMQVILKYTYEELRRIFLGALCNNVLNDMNTITAMKDLLDMLKPYQEQ